MQTVAVLALEDAIAFDLATPIEVFGRVRLPDGRAGYQTVVAGPEHEVNAGPLRIVVDDSLDAVDHADLVVVPGRHDPSRPVPSTVLHALRAAVDRGSRVASICVGAFVLAEAGLLDGGVATTHWRAADDLARQYPRVRVDPDVLYVDSGQVLTSAGAAAGLDLCLHIVENDYGVAVATDAARLAVAPLHRTGGQAQYILRNRPLDRTTTLEPVLAWIERNAHQAVSLGDIAAAADLSVRTLTRRFDAETGQSPMQWLAGVRLRQAQELLETTDYTIERVAGQTGFRSDSNFRAQFTRTVGVTPATYRRTFRK